jgi:hypothetical protein
MIGYAHSFRCEAGTDRRPKATALAQRVALLPLVQEALAFEPDGPFTAQTGLFWAQKAA